MKNRDRARNYREKRQLNKEKRVSKYRRNLFPGMIYLTALMLIMIPLLIKAITVEEVLNNINAGMKRSDTLSEDVIMNINVQGTEKTERMRLYRKGEDKIRIENLGKSGDVTIINGDKMLVKINGKEVIRQTDKNRGFSLIQPGKTVFDGENLKNKNIISIKEDSGNRVVLHLIPKQKEQNYSSMDMIIDKNHWRIVEQKLYSNLGITKMNIEYDHEGNVARISMDTPFPHGSDRGSLTIEYSGVNRGVVNDSLFDIR